MGIQMRLAEHIAAELRVRGYRSVTWGDGVLVDAAGDHTRLTNNHPLNVMKAALTALERAPDLFRKTYIIAHDGRARRRAVRCFWLKEEKARMARSQREARIREIESRHPREFLERALAKDAIDWRLWT